LIAIGAIAAVAFGLRALYFVELHQTPMWWALLGDGQSYDEWARRLAAGDWIGSEVFYQTPLYPYLLGLIFTIVGHSLGAVRILQALFGTASCVLIAIAGRSFFSRRAGLVAAALLAIYPEAIFFDGLIQKASLDLLLMSGLITAIGAFRTWRRGWQVALAGLILGAFVLNRENAFVLIPVLIAWLLLAFRGEPIARRLAWAGTSLAGVLVLTARLRFAITRFQASLPFRRLKPDPISTSAIIWAPTARTCRSSRAARTRIRNVRTPPPWRNRARAGVSRPGRSLATGLAGRWTTFARHRCAGRA
jgi:4-amino-4-deoxy-L-arabinose transferase-like glycosyltransferase